LRGLPKSAHARLRKKIKRGGALQSMIKAQGNAITFVTAFVIACI
jgi:hypothetical protein